MNERESVENASMLRENQPDPVGESGPVATKQQRFMMLIIAGIVIVLDQLTKYIVEAMLPLYEMWAPAPALQQIFRFTHVPNTGTAFGLFPSGSLFFAVMAILVSLAIIYYNFAIDEPQFLLRLALGLQLGGAIGNLVDRLRLGHVTDFLDFGPWPVFNLADTAIVAGAFMLGWMVIQEAKEERAAARQEADSREPSESVDEWSTS